MTREVRILREGDVRAAIDMAACIDACREAFAAYSSGRASTPDVISLDIPEHAGSVHVKAGHLRDAPFFAVKVAAGFPGNAALDLPTSDGMVLVFDARTGAPAAFLLDGGYLTDLRTGAAGGVAAAALAREDVRIVTVIGTGAQAAYQLDALAMVRPGISEVRLWGRDRGRTIARASDLRARLGLPGGCEILAAPDVRAAVIGADIVITCTASREPLVRAEWIGPGTHITAVGADDVGKQELDADILTSADLVVVDSRAQCVRLGEVQHGGSLDPSDLVELGEICAGAHPGRTSPQQVTVCDLTGLGAQDVAAANAVMANAAGRGDVILL